MVGSVVATLTNISAWYNTWVIRQWFSRRLTARHRYITAVIKYQETRPLTFEKIINSGCTDKNKIGVNQIVALISKSFSAISAHDSIQAAERVVNADAQVPAMSWFV